MTQITRVHKSADGFNVTFHKTLKKILGYYSNALYLWSFSQEMPTGYLTYESFESYTADINLLLTSTYGFYLVDISVPEHMYNTFSEFPPIFRNCTIKADKSRKLISLFSH